MYGNIIITNAPISHGSSGGGLFDSDANLIGITTSYLEGGQNLNIAYPVEWVKRLAISTPKQLAVKPKEKKSSESKSKTQKNPSKDHQERQYQKDQENDGEETIDIAILEKERFESEELDNNFCNEVLGMWSWKGWKVISTILREGGKIDIKYPDKDDVYPPEVYTAPCTGERVITFLLFGLPICTARDKGLPEYKWNCSDPKSRTINLNFASTNTGELIQTDITATLSEDGQCLKTQGTFDGCFRRDDYKPKDAPKIPVNRNPLGQ